MSRPRPSPPDPGQWPPFTWLTILAAYLCATLLCASAHAAQAPAVDLSRVSSQQKLIAQLLILEDSRGSLKPEEAIASRAWQPATSSLMTPALSKSAFWLQGTLENGSAQAITRWLSIGVVRLEDIRFYLFAPGAAKPSEMLLGGNRLPLAQHPVYGPLTVFPIKLNAAEKATFLVRVQSRSSISMIANVWTPTEFRAQEEKSLAARMLIVGLMTGAALYALFLSLMRRDSAYLLLGGVLLLSSLYDLAFQGVLYHFLLTQGGEAVLRAPATLGAAAAAAFSLLTLRISALKEVRFWRLSYGVYIPLQLLCAVWTLSGDYRVAASVQAGLSVIGNFMIFISLLDGCRRKFPGMRLLLLGYIPDGFRLFLRLGYNFGLWNEHWVIGNETALSALSFVALPVLMSILYNMQQQRQKQEERKILLEAQTREQQNLQQAVDERTRELQTALIAAGEANRAKSDFLARISHDLRTPLTSIIGFADLIQVDGRPDAERGGIIRRSATHMLHMVNDLIDYASGGASDAVRREPVYLHALLQSIAEESESAAQRKGNRFSLEVGAELPPVLELDGKRVRQLLGNLIDNANKFTEQGRIVLSVAYRPGGNAPRMTLTVMDSGCGIAHEDQQRIFEPFQRLNQARSQPGVGLGLSIVRHWVERMGGELFLDSAPGIGTSIRIALPARALPEADMDSYHMPDALGLLPRLDGHGLRIWVAEDTEEIRQFLADELASQGFAVEAAKDGRDLIEMIIHPDARPDLILTDHMMPGADGLDVLAVARRHLPGVPVVALSALPAPDGSDRLRYDAALLKPVNLADLRNTLGRLLRLSSVAARPGEASPAPQLLPPAPLLAEARQWIELGAMSDLLDWTQRLAAQDPRYQAFAQRVQQLARQGELAPLQALCQAQPSP